MTANQPVCVFSLPDSPHPASIALNLYPGHEAGVFTICEDHHDVIAIRQSTTAFQLNNLAKLINETRARVKKLEEQTNPPTEIDGIQISYHHWVDSPNTPGWYVAADTKPELLELIRDSIKFMKEPQQ